MKGFAQDIDNKRQRKSLPVPEYSYLVVAGR